LREAAVKMQELGVHHLPVEDDRGSLVGMISATDIFVAVEESGWES
jgi:CBS domain-containing protein